MWTYLGNGTQEGEEFVQVACVSYTNLKQNKAFSDKTDKCLSTQFDGETSSYMKKTVKRDSTRDISMIMFYNNRQSLIFKVLGVSVYWFLGKCVCVNYFCLQREVKFSLLHRWFEDTSFNELSVIGIPKVLLNIVSYYSYIQDNNSTLILTCRSKFVSYYLSKGFVVILKISQILNNVPKTVQNIVDAINIFMRVIL